MQKDSNSGAVGQSSKGAQEGSQTTTKEEKKKHATLHLQSLAITVSTNLLKELLQEKKIVYHDCNVQVNEEKKCESGIGSISFTSKTELVTAAKSLKGLMLEGKPIDYKVPQSGEFSATTSVYVGNLHDRVKEEDLIKEFSKLGFIHTCQVQTHKNTSKSKEFAFIDFENKEVADKVIEQMNGKQKKYLTPTQLLVQGYQNLITKKQSFEQNQSHATKTNLFVDHLPVSYSEQELTKLFSEFGTVQSVRIKRLRGYPNQNNILPTTFHHQAYVNMGDAKMAEEAIQGLNGRTLDLNQLRVQYYEKGTNYHVHNQLYAQQEENDILNGVHYKILFIRGLPKNVTQEQLNAKCQKHGDVLNCQLKKSSFQGGPVVSRGMAIVSFQKKIDAQKAQQGLYMDKELGEELDIDYYRDKNLRMQDYEIRNNPFNQLIQGFNMQGPGGHGHRNQAGFVPMNTRVQSSFAGYPNSNPNYSQHPRGGFQYRINSQQSMNQRSSIPQQYQHQNRQRPRNSNRNAQYHQNSTQNKFYDQKKPYYNNNQQTQRPPYQNFAQRPNGFQNFQQQPMQGQNWTQPQIVPAVIVNLEEFNKIASDQERKSMLGNLMYPLISEKDVSLAGKVTGMILEQPISNILQLLGNKDQFLQTVDQALNLIQSSQAGVQQQQPVATEQQ